MVTLENPASIRKATVMVPSLFTVGNMAMGFFAITAAFDSRWIAAPIAIFVAHLMDILDGRLARWLGQSSHFGGEFDSFADWISFGLAPGIMIYLLVLKDFGKPGFLLAFFYVLAGAFRLARFNVKSVETVEGGSHHFTGLPIPGAGGFIAVLVLLFGLFDDGRQGRTMNLIYNHIPFLRAGIPIIVFGLSLLLISKLEYATFKKVHIFRPKSLRTFLITLFGIFMVYAYPQNTIFILYASYILWGIIATSWRVYRLRRAVKT